jgi:hypothetical protein
MEEFINFSFNESLVAHDLEGVTPMVKEETSQATQSPDERSAAHIQQDESLWKIAEQCIRSTTTRTAAARAENACRRPVYSAIGQGCNANQ